MAGRKNSYGLRVYEPVDDRSLSWFMSQKWIEKIIKGCRGLRISSMTDFRLLIVVVINFFFNWSKVSKILEPNLVEWMSNKYLSYYYYSCLYMSLVNLTE